MEDLNVGTIEIITVSVDDRSGTVSDLSPYAVDFKVIGDDDADKIAWTSATDVNGLKVDCLVDTTGWATGHYELYIRPTIGSEQPIIGPFDFDLV